MIALGFTGTRNISPEQRAALPSLLSEIQLAKLHHGGCVGADEAAHAWAVANGVPIVVHPPTNDAHMMSLVRHDDVTVLPAREYLRRNRDIVLSTRALIAVPDGAERLRSGTWATVRFARNNQRKIVFLWPDGTVTRERPDDD